MCQVMFSCLAFPMTFDMRIVMLVHLPLLKNTFIIGYDMTTYWFMHKVIYAHSAKVKECEECAYFTL